ncbi:hypothetical protein MIND_00795200 [Mycena indigotica]|uniref:Uncharacterized protein n=1 Tax=Mycena indigotica TaxID=2126181 RepID=A0A8H6SNU5_9AGAR|nr:uncharacterized protein MIND_00795200 [Mycena indigotica]KAF7302280.1 hypothetical protein MIND_00795200 [Mycena indigotica]
MGSCSRASTSTLFNITENVLQATHSVSPVFPPLQAASALVIYIQDSLHLFRSNKEQIRSLAEYCTRLSQELSSTIDGSKTTKYVEVIKNIQQYLESVARKPSVVRYLERKTVAANLQSFRDELWQEFLVFSMSATIDLQSHQQAFEVARKQDERDTQELIKKLAEDVHNTAAGTKQLASALSLPSRQGPDKQRQILQELQVRVLDSNRPEAEAVVLRESIRLAQICVAPNYRWYSNTFNEEHALSEIKDALSLCVDDIARDLSESGLLPRMTTIDIRHARNEFEKVTHLFRALDSRAGDVVLIRAFQLALVSPRTDGRMDSFVKPGLLAQIFV